MTKKASSVQAMQPRTLVWYDADGRIAQISAGPFDRDLKMLEDDQAISASSYTHYVKNRKLVERPHLIPDNSDSLIHVETIDDLPDFPAGSMVTINENERIIMDSKGKPPMPAGVGQVILRIDPFPAKPIDVVVAKREGRSSDPS